MAWNYAWGRKEKKEAAKHLRSQENRDAIIEPVKTGKKGNKQRKKFLIEARYKKQRFVWSKDWFVYSRYHTEQQRQIAFEALSKKYDFYEFRFTER